MSDTGRDTPDSPGRICPTCEAEVGPRNPFRPFCTARCKWVDLGRWLDGHYVVPGEGAVDFESVLEYEEGKARGGDDETNG